MIFCPSKSPLRDQYIHELPSCLANVADHPENWDSILYSFTVEDERRQRLTFSSSGQYLASIIHTGVDLRDSITGVSTQLIPWNRNLRQTRKLAFSPDDQLLAVQSVSAFHQMDGTDHFIDIWNVATGTCFRHVAIDQTPKSVDFTITLDNRLLICGFDDLCMTVIDLQTQTRERCFLDIAPGGMEQVHWLSLSQSGRLQAIVFDDRNQKAHIGLWDLSTGSLRWQSEPVRSADSHCTFTKFAGNDKLLFTAFSNSLVQIWNTDTGESLQPSGIDLIRSQRPGMLAVSSNGELVASQFSSNPIRIWKVSKTTVELFKVLGGIIDLAFDLEFSPDGCFLASLDSDYVNVWDVTPTTQDHAPKSDSHIEIIGTLCYNKRKSMIASGSGNGKLSIWSLASGVVGLSKTLSGHPNSRITFVKFSDDGRWLVSVDKIGTCKLWDLSTDGEKLVRAVAANAELRRYDWMTTAVVFHEICVVALASRIIPSQVSFEFENEDAYTLQILDLKTMHKQNIQENNSRQLWPQRMALSKDAKLLAFPYIRGSPQDIDVEMVILIIEVDSGALRSTILHDGKIPPSTCGNIRFSEDGTELESDLGYLPVAP